VIAREHAYEVVYTLVYTDGTRSLSLPRWHAVLTITSSTQDHDERHRLLQRLDAAQRPADAALQATINALLGEDR
jgi:hypothetical protein